MMPDYIHIYDRNTKAIKVLMGLGVFLALLGVSGLFWYWIKKDFIFYAESFWQMGFLIFQGLITVYVLWNALKSKRYFISWDEHEIHYLLPKSKQPEWIKLPEIQSVDIESKRVVLSLENSEQKCINLNFFYFPKRTRVVEYFQSLRDNLES